MFFRRHTGTSRTILAAAAAMAALLIASATSLAGGTSSVAQFTRAWGWGVSDGSSQFETCTTTCQAGIAGGGAGELRSPIGVAVNSSSGDIYVASYYNNRIDEFTSAGTFIGAWGWGVKDGANQFETCTTTCLAGIPGGSTGELWNPGSVAVDSSTGVVYVVEQTDARIDEFSASGAFIRTWGWGVADGAQKFEICTGNCQEASGGGGAAGQMQQGSSGIAVHGSDVYYADARNNRIDEFSTAGTFIRAWGWGVSDGANQLESCTATCQQGIAGSGTGQLHLPDGVATDSQGDVYVTDGNPRINEFSATGAFIRAWGWGVNDGMNKLETCTSSCQPGIGGSGAGALSAQTQMATDPAGNVYVADQGEERIDQFTATGGFVKAWGWGVLDGASRFETCTTRCQMGSTGGGAGEFDAPTALAVDSSGHVFVADQNSNRVELFTLFLQPSVTGLNPKSGPASGGTKVTITGAHFAHARRVMFGTEPAPFKVVSDTKITATSPDGTPGTTVTVRVTTPGGITALHGSIQFHYVRHVG